MGFFLLSGTFFKVKNDHLLSKIGGPPPDSLVTTRNKARVKPKTMPES